MTTSLVSSSLLIATTDDGNHWVTERCWFWCGRVSTRVCWVGPVTVVGVEVPVYACERCMTALADMALDTIMARDVTTTPNVLEFPRGRHRLI